MKILNLYAGIGGNRKLWGDEHQITAVELNPKIAEIYKSLYPNDSVIVGDAHEYLRVHFREFDFIWASPPCPSHSILQYCRYHEKNLKYPDMTLYQEIILLKHFFKGKWVIENVKPYYEPLISPTFKIDRHYFWASDFILSPPRDWSCFFNQVRDSNELMAQRYDYDLEKLKPLGKDLRKVLRNCVLPEVGKYIFENINKRNIN